MRNYSFRTYCSDVFKPHIDFETNQTESGSELLATLFVQPYYMVYWNELLVLCNRRISGLPHIAYTLVVFQFCVTYLILFDRFIWFMRTIMIYYYFNKTLFLNLGSRCATENIYKARTQAPGLSFNFKAIIYQVHKFKKCREQFCFWQ